MDIVERFWSHVDKSGGPDACWPWTAARLKAGYGIFQAEKTRTSHRFAWEATNGPILDGLHVLHKCDNPPCVNPVHLFLGDNKANMRDRDAKGRTLAGDAHPARTRPDYMKRGSAHWRAKLTESDVQSIRASVPGESMASIARRYGVSPESIGDIVHRRTWRHVA